MAVTSEHPDWKPWWIRYAEFGGRCVLLGDHFAVPHPIQEGWKQYEVIVGTPKSTPRPYNCPCGCRLVIDKHWIGNRLYLGNDLDEALAAFYEAEAELIGATA